MTTMALQEQIKHSTNKAIALADNQRAVLALRRAETTLFLLSVYSTGVSSTTLGRAIILALGGSAKIIALPSVFLDGVTSTLLLICVSNIQLSGEIFFPSKL